MRLSAAVALLLSLAANVSGLYESQAGTIDWHKPYIGIPKLTRWTSPRFHQIVSSQPNVPSKAVVIVGTQKNVLAALNPSDGAVGKFCQTRTSIDALIDTLVSSMEAAI